MDYTFDNTISYEDYKALRVSAGWQSVSERQFELGLKNLRYFAAAKHNGKAVGMIKGLGDNGYYWIITDLIILPEYQSQGLGKKLVGDFLEYVDNSVVKGENVSVFLFSVKGKELFYEKFGFKTRPFGDIYGAGMSIHYEKE
ncbi:MAG: GNAT family N-acetyltransferase [Oscillospiraceae bacterium]|nr:GNAT family N-acetyltransferase [Oscillospiraceae bacterium]